jgi:glycosyltransferase involved in cell wall biosynthesis
MRLMAFVSQLALGGAERVAADLAGGWAELGHEVTLVTLAPLDDVEYRPQASVRLVSLAGDVGPDRAGRGGLDKVAGVVRRLAAVERIIRREKPDIVIGIQANMAIEVALASLFHWSVRAIGCEHNNPRFSVRGRFWRALRPLAYHRLQMVVVLTDGAERWFRAHQPAFPVRVIPNPVQWPLPVNPPEIAPDDVVARGRKIAFAAGRFVEAKGFDQLLEVAVHLTELAPDIDVVIAGDGPLRPSIATQIESRGLGGRVFLPGRVGNMSDWYARSSFFVMTSRWEGMPMVLLEAMSSGLPAICYDFDYGPSDMIREGCDGMVVPQGDARQMARAIAELAGDSDRLANMSTAARAVRNRFNRSTVLDIWNNLFAGLASQSNEERPLSATSELIETFCPGVDSVSKGADQRG